MARWAKWRILREVERMEARNWANEESSQKIRECGHPLAAAIADALDVHAVFDDLRTTAGDVFYDAEQEAAELEA